MAELGDRPLRRRARRRAAAAAAGPRPSPSSTRRTSAGPGSRSARSGPATASSPGCAGTPRRTTRPPSASIAAKNGSRGSVLADPAVRTRSAGVGTAREPREGRLDGVGVVVDVDDVDDLRAEALDLGPDARLELARARSPRTDSLTTTPTRRWHERRRPRRPAALPNAGDPRAGLDDAGVDDVRRDLDARHEVARSTTWPSKTVKTSSGSSRLSRSSSATQHVDDAGGRGDQVDPALVRARGPRGSGRRRPSPAGSRRRPRAARPARRRARVTGGPRSAAASASRSSADSRRPLDQRLPPTDEVAGEDRRQRAARARADQE